MTDSDTKPKKKSNKVIKKVFREHLTGMATDERLEKYEALKLQKKLKPKPKELLSPDGEITLADIDECLRDPFSEKADLLKTEWAFYGGELHPEVWLETIKGYTVAQAKRIVSFEGIDAWNEKRLKFQNQALENFAQRSVDTLVEFQDYIAKGAKLNTIRALEMLQTPVKKIDPVTGKWIPGLTSMDLKNCIETIDKAQSTVMRAMGIHPKEEIGVKIVYEQLKTIQMQNAKDVTAGATFTEDGKEVTIEGPTDDPRLQTLTNDEMWAMIEILREQRKNESKS